MSEETELAEDAATETMDAETAARRAETCGCWKISTWR